MSDLEISFDLEFRTGDRVEMKHAAEGLAEGVVRRAVVRFEVEYEVEWQNGVVETYNRSALRRGDA